MIIQDCDPQKNGEEYLKMLEQSLTDLRRLHRKCEAHGATKSVKEVLLQIEDLEKTIEIEHHIYDMVMANR